MGLEKREGQRAVDPSAARPALIHGGPAGLEAPVSAEGRAEEGRSGPMAVVAHGAS
jgi:hypothetical protein